MLDITSHVDQRRWPRTGKSAGNIPAHLHTECCPNGSKLPGLDWQMFVHTISFSIHHTNIRNRPFRSYLNIFDNTSHS